MPKTILLCCLAVVALACGGTPPSETDATNTAPAADLQDTAAAEGPRVLSGEVLETMDAGGYTYLKIGAESGTVWAAANQFEIEVGERVTIPLEMPMTNFRSDTLDRTFDRIYFVSVVGREGGAPIGGGGEDLGLPTGHPRLAAFDFEGGSEASEDPLMKAVEGALPIAEIWQRRTELAGSEVTVAGRVVTYNGGILGTNWLHVQDGTGAVEDGTNDLTVTSTTPCAVGDIVIATGILNIDRDFGAGYTYTVILEDATITK